MTNDFKQFGDVMTKIRANGALANKP